MKYDITARFLHWLSALIILWAIFSGFFIGFSNVDEVIKRQVADLNISITLVFIPFFIWRVFHRISHHNPSSNFLSGYEANIAKSVHVLLYILIAIVLFSGILMIDREIIIFDIFKIPQTVNDLNALSKFGYLHSYSTKFLALLIVLHVLAVAKHEFRGKPILKRMI